MSKQLQTGLLVTIAASLVVIAITLVVIVSSPAEVSQQESGDDVVNDGDLSVDEEQQAREEQEADSLFGVDSHDVLLFGTENEEYAIATFVEEDENSTRATVTFLPGKGETSHSAAIHSGTCDEPGGVEYDLGITSGEETSFVFDSVYEEFIANIALAITLTPQGQSTHAACGNT